MTRIGLPPLTLAWMAVLTYLSSLEPEALGPELPFAGADKTIHAGFYALLLLSFMPASRLHRARSEWLPFAIGASLAFGICDELHQSFVAGRFADPLDFAADAGGVIAAALVLGTPIERILIYRPIR
ncbi:MAG: VanZ family protein [Planctomycetes bacterium]|nr:VanZ family protein [Planctomycetota bacterium]